MNPIVTLPSKEVIINHFKTSSTTQQLYQRYSSIMDVVAEHLAGQNIFSAGVELNVLLRLDLLKVSDPDKENLRGPLITALKTCSYVSSRL